MWIKIEEKKEVATSLSALELEVKDVERVLKAGLISQEGDFVTFTDEGYEIAKEAIRRHRLAERLMVDVLDTKPSLVEEISCKFEHLLHKGLEENICILLGHPRVCPHGNRIPEGSCCLLGTNTVEKIVSPLIDIEPGKEGEVAYIYTDDSEILQKLLAMGILPGTKLKVIQKFPAYVFTVGQTQIATDVDIAKSIYLRVVQE